MTNISPADIELVKKSFLPDRFRFDLAMKALLERKGKRLSTVVKT